MIAGVDEAGRGPVVGSMVMALVAVKKESDLPEGLKDSKLLTAKRREELFEEIVKLPHALRICPPKEIDEWVNQGKLNYLEAEKTIELINEIKPKKCIIDCPSRNLEAYKSYIEQKTNAEIHVQFKADVEHPVVAAASILAKVTRDRIIDEIKQECGIDFGSGYLTDPKTQAMMKNFDPTFAHYRKSWRPYKDLVKQSQQKTLF